jgi:hypothetical protein
MGEGVEQRGNSHVFGEVYAAERPEALPAEEVDSGAHVLLALSEQEAEQGLREAAGELGSLHLRSDESPDGDAIGPFMRLFRQFQETVRKVPEVSTTQPYGLKKQLFSDHFGLRIPAKSTLRASIAPFSDSLKAKFDFGEPKVLSTSARITQVYASANAP